uniref:Eph LBD domain-containing protein n=1 Tax=Anas zonorhyncha TaxID=75864 RepID=A0A8B9V6K7_9AVES
MDTKWVTSELAWTTHPETGWEEVSGYDEAMNPIRTYQVCNVREANQNNWLRTKFIQRQDVQRVYVELKFTVRDCNSIPNIPGSCKETFNLFYYESDTDSASASSPFWMENPYIKVDTIAPDESFSKLESGRVNTKVRSFGPRLWSSLRAPASPTRWRCPSLSSCTATATASGWCLTPSAKVSARLCLLDSGARLPAGTLLIAAPTHRSQALLPPSRGAPRC